MEKTLLRHFEVEVERQCQFAMIALQDMEEASANSDGTLLWYSVQNLLLAVGRTRAFSGRSTRSSPTGEPD
jgi:hypothetical protein